MSELVHTVDFIRHAHSEMNGAMANPNTVPFIGGRQNEVDLDELGERQARELGQWNLERGFIPTLIYCSPAKRTRRTQSLSAEVMGIDLVPIIDDRLQELDQGDWTNQPRTLYDDYQEEMARLRSDFAAPNGESTNNVGDRVLDFLDGVAVVLDEAEEPQRVEVHTHGGTTKSMLGRLLGWPHEQIYQTEIGNVSRTRLLRIKGSWIVDSYQAMPRTVHPAQL